MGIDWEEQLGAEGADMARAYEDSLPEEDCGTTSHYVSGTRFEDDVVGSYIYETMDNFDSTLRDWGFYDKDACVGEPSFDDPCWKLESKTSDELIEECIKFSQEAKHVKCVLKDAGQDIDTLFDYLDSRALCDQNVSAGEREEDRRIIESKLRYEEESMGDDELREKCRAMTRDELIDKHIDIEGIKDAAEEKIKKIERLVGDDASVAVLVSAKKGKINAKRAEVTVKFNGNVVRAEVTDDDLYKAMNDAVDIAAERVKKMKEKGRKRAGSKTIREADATEVADTCTSTYDAAQMVKMIDREKMIAAEVMSREEACVEMEYTDHDFYVFRDSDRDDTLSILYKRKEKGYGLLVVDEPF